DAAAVGNVREEDPLAPAAGGVRGAVHPGRRAAGVDARGNLVRRIPPAGADVLEASLVDELPVVGVVAGNADAVLSGHGEIAEGLPFRVSFAGRPPGLTRKRKIRARSGTRISRRPARTGPPDGGRRRPVSGDLFDVLLRI